MAPSVELKDFAANKKMRGLVYECWPGRVAAGIGL
jgi:hypothetical protein